MSTNNQIPDAYNPYYSNAVAGATFTVGAETSNAVTVNVRLLNRIADAVGERVSVEWFLSDDASGDSLVATAADGGVAGGTDGWVSSTVTGKRGRAVSESNGRLDIVVTHTGGVKVCYLGLAMPSGAIVMSGALTFA